MWGVDGFEEGFGCLVYTDIGRLRGQCDRDEQGVCVCPFKVAFGFGVVCAKAAKEFVDVGFFHSLFVWGLKGGWQEWIVGMIQILHKYYFRVY